MYLYMCMCCMLLVVIESFKSVDLLYFIFLIFKIPFPNCLKNKTPSTNQQKA